MKVPSWLGSWRAPRAVMVAGNAVTLLHDGEQCYPAMLEAIASAQREILLEMYWFASDRTGRRFADALSARARDGVRVRVIFDAVGSWEADRGMFAEMRATGCEVHEYNPIAPFRKRFRIGVVNRRDHRKILVIDGCVAMTGGVNIGDPWAAAQDGGAGWRDDMIRIDGPAAGQMRALFMRTWADLGRSQERFSHVPSDSEVQAQYGDCPVRVVTNARFGDRRAMRRVYLEQIKAARAHIFIANSYFVPDRIVRRDLARAVDRGVDVRVLVPGESDVVAVHYASRRLYGWLMRRGIKLYQWQRTVLHCKTAVIDSHWCTVGTYNLDYRSWRFNLEVNVTVEDDIVGQAMTARFEQDLAHAAPINPRDFGFRPLSERLAEQFFYLFRKLL